MSKALLKYIRLSPTKARLIAREIQGMNAELALATLEFAPNKAAKVIYKVLASAIANGNYDAQSVVVKSCRIDAGPVLRRMSPRARGRANMIRKPTAHILVEVDEPQKAQKVDSKPKNTNQKKLDSTKTPKSAPKAPKKENAVESSAESKNAESSKKTTPKATKAPKDLGDSNTKAESKSTKDSSVKELKVESKADSSTESKPKAKKSSATKTAKTTTSEDK